MNTASSSLDALRRQVHSNPRLKWGLLFIGVLSGLFVLQAMDGVRRSFQARAMESEARLRQVRALRGQDIWVERAAQATALRKTLDAEIPSVDTAGLAQANAQTLLRELATAASNAQDVNVTVASPVPVDGMLNVVRVRATLNAGMPPRQVLDLLRRVESTTNLMVVESVAIHANQRTLMLNLDVYYRVRNASPRP